MPDGPDGEFFNDSGLPLKAVYRAGDVSGEEPPPGEFPFTRGIRADMYRGRHWTMRQYSGFGTARESNQRYRFLLEQGQTGLSVAFDLPTQIGYDSDHPMANGEVGKVGVAIDSLEDMEVLLDGIPLDRVSTSMTINSTAAMLLLLYQLVAEKQGVAPEKITGTVQNDILTEYAARGTYIFPPKPSMRLVTDLFAYCRESLPNWNTISISGYHMREPGATAADEIAFTLVHALAYDEALGLPSQSAAELALRTQQMIGFESAVPLVADPLGGSYYVESLTDRVEGEALAMMAEVDELGGAVECIERGWTQKRIAESAYQFQLRVESGERVVVGVNRYAADQGDRVEIMKVSPQHQAEQSAALAKLRAGRPRDLVDRHLRAIGEAARGSVNLLPVLKAALADYVTSGGCCDVLRQAFGEYRPTEAA